MAYNNVCRRILGYSRFDSASQMFVYNSMDGFDTIVRKNVYGFTQRLQHIENDLVQSVLSCVTFSPNILWNRWNAILFLRHE